MIAQATDVLWKKTVGKVEAKRAHLSLGTTRPV